MRLAVFLLSLIAVCALRCSGRKPIAEGIPESCLPVMKQTTRYYPQNMEHQLGRDAQAHGDLQGLVPGPSR